jgi:hypothetical protein
VERFYSDIVYLASDAEEFVRQIDVALNEHPAERARRQLREEKILAEHAWDAIAANMNRLMEDAYAKKTDLRTTADVRLQKARPIRTSIAPTPLSGQ